MSLPSDIPENMEVKDVVVEKVIKKATKQKVIQKVDKNNAKYIVLLKLLNGILENIGKDQITEVTQFVDISRTDIIKQENVDILKTMTKELFPLFNKNRCHYGKSDSFVCNCLRDLVKQIGYCFSYKKKDVYVDVNGKNFRNTDMIYSIK
jgi:hypothetical protein